MRVGNKLTVNLGDIAAGAQKVVTVRWEAQDKPVDPKKPDEFATLVNSATAEMTGKPPFGPARATVEVGNVMTLQQHDVVAAGVGLRHRGGGTIKIEGIPAGATVTRAVLVWAVLKEDKEPAKTIRSAPPRVTADVAIKDDRLCWKKRLSPANQATPDDTGTTGFVKDVTNLVPGNGNYRLTGYPGAVRPNTDDLATPNSFPVTDGATLFVFFTKGTEIKKQVVARFNYDTNEKNAISRVFPINNTRLKARGIVAGPDGQSNFNDASRWTTTVTADSMAIFDNYPNIWTGANSAMDDPPGRSQCSVPPTTGSRSAGSGTRTTSTSRGCSSRRRTRAVHGRGCRRGRLRRHQWRGGDRRPVIARRRR